jgi:hypothetical protein
VLTIANHQRLTRAKPRTMVKTELFLRQEILTEGEGRVWVTDNLLIASSDELLLIEILKKLQNRVP